MGPVFFAGAEHAPGALPRAILAAAPHMAVALTGPSSRHQRYGANADWNEVSMGQEVSSHSLLDRALDFDEQRGRKFRSCTATKPARQGRCPALTGSQNETTFNEVE